VREILDGLLDVVFRDVLSSAMARGRAHPPTVFVSLSRLFVTQTNEVTQWKKVNIASKTRMFFKSEMTFTTHRRL